MGTWSAEINGNDKFMEVYETFPEYFFSYVDGQWLYDTEGVKQQLAERFSFVNAAENMQHEYWLALAKRFWEFGVTDEVAFGKVKQLIESGSDLALWKELNATEEDLVKRKKALDKFLFKISQPNPTPKIRKQVINHIPLFKTGDLITFLYEGNYYAAVTSGDETNKYGIFILHLLNYRSPQKPDQATLLECEYMSIDFRPQVQYAPEELNKPNRHNVQGFLWRNKCFAKATIQPEKVGFVTFHHHGYYNDGPYNFHSAETDPGDNLAKLAAMNYLPEGFGGNMLLKYYTDPFRLTPEMISSSLQAIEEGKDFTLHGVTIRPGNIMANATFTYLYYKGLEQFNKYELGNLLAQLYGTVRSDGTFRITYLKFEGEVPDAPEYGSRVIPLAEYFRELKAKAASGKKIG